MRSFSRARLGRLRWALITPFFLGTVAWLGAGTPMADASDPDDPAPPATLQFRPASEDEDPPAAESAEPGPASAISNEGAVKTPPIGAPAEVPEITAEMIADAAAKAIQTVRPQTRATRFSGAEPGRTTASELKEKWGEPLSTTTRDGATLHTYKIGPFSRIEARVVADKVASIVIHLEEPMPLESAVDQLDLDGIVPAPVADSAGESLGQAYPERGVALTFVPGRADRRVAQIVLEPIGPEPFILRVEYDFEHLYERNLADLDEAVRLAPGSARALWLRASLLAELGELAAARASAASAVTLDKNNLQYRLTEAKILGASGDFTGAIEKTRDTIMKAESAPELKARGACQLGDLTAAGPGHPYQQAIQHHLAAIKLAAPLANDERAAVRRAAKRILLDAHLAVAGDVAWGNWQKRPETTNQWLARANELASDLVANEDADGYLLFVVKCKTILAYAGLRGAADPNGAARALEAEADRLLASATDPLYKQKIRWELGLALVHAAHIEHVREQFSGGQRYAERAISLFNQSLQGTEPTPEQGFQIGRAHFVAGALLAVHRNDHRKAVESYEMALTYLDRPLPPLFAPDEGRSGEWLVSMGVSYWQIDDKDEGLRLTQLGVARIERAVEAGHMDKRALAVPYGNLASMLRERGETEKARQYAERSAQLETPNRIPAMR
jgi:tetratricopeptide (TPR) repeat protein